MLKRQAGEQRLAARTLTIGLILAALAGASPGRAFELPGLGILFGTESPLTAFPDTLPAHVSTRLAVNLHDLYRSRRGPQLQEYGILKSQVLVLMRAGPGWLGFHYSNDRLRVIQHQVHGKDDALDGRRVGEHPAAAFALRMKGWEGRAMAGLSDNQPEGAIQLEGRLKPFEQLRGRAWLARTSLDVSQRFGETTFFFPFRSRDACVQIEARLPPLLGHRIAVQGDRRVLKSDKIHPEQYNVLELSRSQLETRITRLRHPQVDLLGRIETGTLNLTMALDGTRYLKINDLSVRRQGAELGWSLRSKLRIAGGVDQWRIYSDDPSYVDAWPFTVWDVFTATRFRLITIENTWRITYARVTMDFSLRRNISINLDGRFEWWHDDGTLRWKERVPVFPPFYFRYVSHTEPLDLPFRRAVQLDVETTLQLHPRWNLSLAGQMIYPFGKRKGRQPTEPSEVPTAGRKSTWGGMRLMTSLEMAW